MKEKHVCLIVISLYEINKLQLNYFVQINVIINGLCPELKLTFEMY